LLACRITCSIALGAAALLALGCVSPPDGAARIRAQLSERSGEDATRAELADPDDAMPGEDELVAFALRRSAQFRAALADLGIAEAEWLRAGAPPPATFSVLLPLGSKQLEYAAKFPVDMLWLRPKRLAAAKRDWAATAERVVASGLDLVRDVRIECANANAASRLRALERGHTDPYRGLAEYTERRFRAGGLAAVEVARAKLRAASVADRRTHESGALAASTARLAELTALEFRDWPCATPAQSPPLPAIPFVDDLVRDALAARPELRAAELEVEAAGERAGLARREVIQLIAVFDANGSGGDAEIGPGVELGIPLDGGRAARALADAKLAQASARYEAAVQRVTREVREAHALAEAARASALAWRDERVPVLEQWELRARSAYESGTVDAGARLEAEIAALEGRREAVLADAAWRRARAELERAVGHRLAFANGASAEPVTTLTTPVQP
jgi:cobalt-zinc-cadmium efflux system outer membrane protein